MTTRPSHDIINGFLKLTNKNSAAIGENLASSAGLSMGSSLRIGFEKKYFWERGLP
jgi:hypothetical protein